MSQNSKASPPTYLPDLTRKQRQQIQQIYGIIRNPSRINPTSRPLPGTAAYIPGFEIFPLIAPALDHGQVGLSSESIDLSNRRHWFHRMFLINNINIAFSNPPQGNPINSTDSIDKNTQFIDGYIEFIQDGVGGRTVTFPASVVSPPTINSAAGSKTVVHWMTADGGVTYHVVDIKGSGSSAWNGNATSNLDMNTFDIIDVDSLKFTVDNQVIAGADRSITPLVVGLQLNIPTGTAFRISVNGTLEYAFDSGGIDMESNSINDLNDIFFTEPGISILHDAGGLDFLVAAGDTFQYLIGGALAFEILSGSINLHGRSIDDLNDILFSVSGQSILSDAAAISFNVPTGDAFQWLINGVLFARLNSLGLQMESQLDMQANSIVDVGAIAMSDPNMIINDATNIFSVNVGAAQTIELIRGAVTLVRLGGSTLIRSDSNIALQVTGAGDFIAFNDGGSARIIYDWQTDDFYPLDGQSNLGRATNRWAEVFAVVGSINTSFTKYKKDIREITDDDCLQICKQLPTIKFKWDKKQFPEFKDKEKEKGLCESDFVGINADALKTLCPEAVRGDGVVMNSILALLVGAVRKLEARLDALEKS